MAKLFLDSNSVFYNVPEEIGKSTLANHVGSIVKYSNYTYYIAQKDIYDKDGNLLAKEGTRVSRKPENYTRYNDTQFNKVVEADDIEWRPFVIPGDTIWRTIIYKGGLSVAEQSQFFSVDSSTKKLKTAEFNRRILYSTKNNSDSNTITVNNASQVLYQQDTQLYYFLYDDMYLRDTDDLISYISKLNSFTGSSIGNLGQIGRSEYTHTTTVSNQSTYWPNSHITSSQDNATPEYRKNRPDFVNNITLTQDGKLTYTMGEFTNVWTYNTGYIGANVNDKDDLVSTYAISYAYINQYGQLSYEMKRIFHNEIGKEYRDTINTNTEVTNPAVNFVNAIKNINLDRYGHVISTDSYSLPTKQYVDALIEASDALHYCGSFTPTNIGLDDQNEVEVTYNSTVQGTWTSDNQSSSDLDLNDNGDHTNVKTYITTGSVYKVSVNGWFGNKYVHAGDLLISYSDYATKTSTDNWDIIETHVSALTSHGKSKKNLDDPHRVITNVNLMSNGTVSYTYFKLTFDNPHNYNNTPIAAGDNTPDGTQFITNVNVIRTIDNTEMKYTFTYTYGRLTYSTNSTYGLVCIPGNNGTYISTPVLLQNAQVIRSVNVQNGILTYTYGNLVIDPTSEGIEVNTTTQGSVTTTNTYISGWKIDQNGKATYTYANVNHTNASSINTINQSQGLQRQTITNINISPNGDLTYVYAGSIGASYWDGTAYKGEIFNNYTTNKALGNYSHAEGASTTASGNISHAEGLNTTASGDASHAEGYDTTASGYSSHAEGTDTIASGDYSHTEGFNTIAEGDYSHTEGSDTTASGNQSHAEGYYTTASGTASHAEGNDTTASGNYSHAEGRSTTASADYSHVEGCATIAEGEYSHAEGDSTQASGDYSHAEGSHTIASGDYSHAEGSFTKASGELSHTNGFYTQASNVSETSIGNYNLSFTYNLSTITWSKENTDGLATLFSVGNGDNTTRSNAFDVRRNGTAYIYNDLNVTNNIYGKQVIADSILFINYSQLASLVTNNKLIPGAKYRILDYVTTTQLTNTLSTGKQFDLIVTAVSTNKLSHNAEAVLHDSANNSQFNTDLDILQKTYGTSVISETFGSSNLSKWQIWYDIENINWSKTSANGGKGTIYRMIDEYGNDCPYDFKNIKFINSTDNKYYFTFSDGKNAGNDLSCTGSNFLDNKVLSLSNTLDIILFVSDTLSVGNIIDTYCSNISITGSYNKVGKNCNNISINGDNNIIKQNCNHIKFIGNHNTFNQSCSYISISTTNNINYNNLVEKVNCHNITFDPYIQFVNLFVNITTGDDVSLNCTVRSGINGTSSNSMKVIELNQFHYQTGITKNIEFKPANSQVVEV